MTFAPEQHAHTGLVGREALLAMLTYKRPAGSKSERRFINRFIRPWIDYQDEVGNLFKQIGEAPTILFSSHTDTVHRSAGTQRLELADGWIYSVDGDCLGADCATGVWLMLEMIRAKVPGLYVFHREEECGGHGSSFIARQTPHVLEGIQAAIAFDRRGFTSIITHQAWDRCCSEAFSTSFANILPGDKWQSDDTGTFTDTANYVDVIGECTNLSVGYLDQHTKDERQHLAFAEYLRDGLVDADWSKLVIERKPGETESLYSPTSHYDWQPRGSVSRLGWRGEYQRLIDAILDHPDAVATILEDYGMTADDVLEMARR